MPTLAHSNVEPRFRKLALIIARAAFLGVGCYTLSSFYLIYQESEKPPTVSTEVDAKDQFEGDDQFPWGAMPYIVIYWSNIRSVRVCGAWSSSDDSESCTNDKRLVPDWRRHFFNMTDDVPTAKVLSGGFMALINLTMLTPNFNSPNLHTYGHINFLEPPQLSVLVEWESTGRQWFQIFTADPSTPAHLLDNKDNTMLSPELRKHLKMQEYMSVNLNPVSRVSVQEFSLSKEVIPKKGILWGFPGEAEHTTTTWNMVPTVTSNSFNAKGNTGAAGWSKGANMFWFKLSKPTYSKVAPLSVRSRVLSVLSSIGAYFALASTVFYLLFVRRYPLSKAGVLDSALTLHGFTEKEHPMSHGLTNESSQHLLDAED